MWWERRSPPCGKAVTRPSTRQARTQRIALDTAMPKRSAAALQEIPPSTAAITRERRSWDSARVMQAGLPPQQAWGITPRRAGGRGFDSERSDHALTSRAEALTEETGSGSNPSRNAA